LASDLFFEVRRVPWKRSLIGLVTAGSVAFAAEPLPDPKILIDTALHHQDVFARKRSDYVCTYTNHILDGTHRQRGYEVLFINGYEIATLISENGKPLSPEQAAEQRSRSDRSIAEAEKQAPPSVTPMDGGWTFEHKPHTFSQTVEGAIMRTSIFDSETRIIYHGRRSIQMKYHGDKKLHARTDEERAAQVFDGNIILDEADQAVVRIGGAAERDAWDGGRYLVVHSHILGFDEVRVDEGFYLPLAWTVAPPYPESYAGTQDFWLDGCRKYRVHSYIVP
jgi:hypothetical protein